jgi:predicted nucleic acid-binding protein
MRCGATWSGACGVPEAVSDTGPILHLREIGQLPLLARLSPLSVPDLVLSELSFYGIHPAELMTAGFEVTVIPVAEPVWREILRAPGFSQIQPADAQVFAVARSRSFQGLVLTDDLALRRLLESEGALVVGSFGVLIRAYRDGRMARDLLERCVENLLENSTLHLSQAFRSYVRRLLAELP